MGIHSRARPTIASLLVFNWFSKYSKIFFHKMLPKYGLMLRNGGTFFRPGLLCTYKQYTNRENIVMLRQRLGTLGTHLTSDFLEVKNTRP